MEQPISKALIRKFLENQCTPQELEVVSKWLEQPGADRVLHEVLVEQWQDRMENAPEEEPADPQMQHWLNRIRHLTQESGPVKTHPPVIKLRSKPFFLRYAAVWAAMILGISALWFFQIKKEQQPQAVAMVERHNPYGRRSKITLPDSSIIYLGAGSTIRYPKTFTGKTREILLDGEAFFDVVHNPEKAFIVHSADIQTQVLGTSFKIDAFKDHPVTVSVATGKVSVGRIDKSMSGLKSLAVLLPGQNVSWNAATQRVTADIFPVDELEQWKTGKLVFHHTSLKMMAEDLERWYKVRIEITNPEKALEKVSGVIPPTISVADAMNVLSETGHFKYAIRDSTIKIY